MASLFNVYLVAFVALRCCTELGGSLQCARNAHIEQKVGPGKGLNAPPPLPCFQFVFYEPLASSSMPSCESAWIVCYRVSFM